MSGTKEGKVALKAITKARTILLVSQPFYGTLALHLQPVEITEGSPLSFICKTMAVDGKHLFYWPPFVAKCSEQELVGVIAHEVTHCSYQYMTRRNNRDARMWNVAGDFVINQDIIDAGFKLPGNSRTLAQTMAGAEGYLLDPQFKNMSTEEVYARLPEELKQSGGGDGNDPGGCGGVIDAPAGKDGAGASKEQTRHEWEVITRQAINVARNNNAGRLPGHLERLVAQLNKPKITWRDQTRDFVDGCMSKDYSWARPNRRFVHHGIILPGTMPDAMHHLVGCVDVSGSINDNMLRAFVSEMSGAMDEGICDRLTLIYADAHVQHTEEYLPGDQVVAKSTGHGGTDFADTFRWISQNAMDASCVVYLTDMETCSWGEEPHCPVLWACWNDPTSFERLKELPPFGRAIHVDGI
jgi:predicted metal-dependent peptidase